MEICRIRGGVPFGGSRLHLRRSQSRLDIGNLQHQWIRPFFICVEALCAVRGYVQARVILLPGCFGMLFRTIRKRCSNPAHA